MKFIYLLFISSLFSSATFAVKLPDKVEFNKHIRPIFSGTCFNCHGPDKHEVKGKLQLHTFSDATKKLGKKKNRQAIVPGKPELSIAWQRISTDDKDDIMPPADFHHVLSDRDKQLVKKWIEQGANYQAHWAYEPIRKFPEINSLPKKIDSLIVKNLKSIGLTTQNALDEKRVLIRRLSFDLRGMPPSQIEVETFFKDQSAEAWEKVVDSFLATPAYGERLAVHWFDVVRYSNSVGFHGDQTLSSAPYRDYVINAFNSNMPYDRFTREQLAGDLLPKPTQDQLIATAYNRLNKVTKEGGAQAGEYLAKYASDRVANVSAVWLGSTLGCAECHDHKYDPFTAKDFYTMAAFFADIQQKGVYSGGNNGTFAPSIKVYNKSEKKVIETYRQEINELHPKMKLDERKKTKEYKALISKISRIERKAGGCVVTKAQKPLVTRVFPRGNWMDLSGEVVQPAVPHFLPQINKKSRATRLDLANWLCSEKNPLAARAFMNRIWNLYFGSGISNVTEDLGSQGELPVNEELLELLARNFIDSQWNIKKMIKTIVMTRTYRLQTQRTAAMKELDPYNRYAARQSIIRLNAEFIRDTAMKVSGLLNSQVGGRNIMPYQPKDYYSSMNFNPMKARYKAEKDSQQYRRGVYMHWQRTFLHPFLKNFDAPEREVSICSRTSSNTPLQALTLLNDPTFVEAAKAFAQRIMFKGGKTDKSRFNWAFLEALNRPITNEEFITLNKLLDSQLSYFKNHSKDVSALLANGNQKVDTKLNSAQLAAWTQVARTIMNMHEFIVRR
jgi:hypothetical protein